MDVSLFLHKMVQIFNQLILNIWGACRVSLKFAQILMKYKIMLSTGTILCALYSCETSTSTKAPSSPLDEIRLTIYSINSNKYGVKYNENGKPNYNDTVSLLACNAKLVDEYSYVAKDSAFYFFTWLDKDNQPISGQPHKWYFTCLSYKNSLLVSAGHGNILFDFKDYNVRNDDFINALKKNKTSLNPWLFSYMKK